MTALTAITLKLERVYSMMPGTPIPARVVDHWRKSGELDRLIKAGMVEDDSEPKQTRSKSKSMGGGKQSTRVEKPAVTADRDGDEDKED